MFPMLSFFFPSVVHPNGEHCLTISKVAAQITLAQKVYGRSLGLDLATREDTLADLAVMLSNQDLKRLDIDLLGEGGRRVLHQFSWHFGAGPDASAGPDFARATELPVLDMQAVDAHRFVVHRHGRERIYRHLLRVSWSQAEDLPQAVASETQAAHTAKITGGRVSGTLRVAESDRHFVRISRTGVKGYAFGQDLAAPWRTVFLHPKQAAPGTSFRIGQTVSCLLVTTPRGFQARDIRAG